jgi:hypothetical protein
MFLKLQKKVKFEVIDYEKLSDFSEESIEYNYL